MKTGARMTLITSGSIFMALNTNAAYPGSLIDIEFNSLIMVSISGSDFEFNFFLIFLAVFCLTCGFSSSELSLSDSETENLAFFWYLAFFLILLRSLRSSSSESLLDSLSESSSTSLSELSLDSLYCESNRSRCKRPSAALLISLTLNGLTKLRAGSAASSQFSILPLRFLGIPLQYNVAYS